MDCKYQLAVVVVNHNNAKEVLDIFEDLKNQSYTNWCFIVIDDNSSDTGCLDEVKDKRFILVKYPAPFSLGYANKYNFSFRAAIKVSAQYVFKMHTDMKIMSEDMLSSLVNTMNEDEKIVSVGPSIFNGAGEQTWGPGIIKKRCNNEFSVHESYLLKVSYLTENNGFQDEVFTWFGEEMDFFVRIQLQGFKTAQIEEKLIHYGGATSSKFRVEKCFYRSESTLMFLYKHNYKDTLYSNFRIYCDELSGDISFIKSLIKGLKLKLAAKAIFLIAYGFMSGLLKIFTKKVNKYDPAIH